MLWGKSYKQITASPEKTSILRFCNSFDGNIKNIQIQPLTDVLTVELENGVSFDRFVDVKIIDFESDDDAKLWFELGENL